MPRESWAQQDIEKIRSLAGQVSAGELARQLNRTEAAIRFQASKLGVSFKHWSADAMKLPAAQRTNHTSDAVEKLVAPAAVERALSIYQQLHDRDQSVVEQARKILTQHIYGMIDQGEGDAQRLTVGGLVHLKAVERDHVIKSAHAISGKKHTPVG